MSDAVVQLADIPGGNQYIDNEEVPNTEAPGGVAKRQTVVAYGPAEAVLATAEKQDDELAKLEAIRVFLDEVIDSATDKLRVSDVDATTKLELIRLLLAGTLDVSADDVVAALTDLATQDTLEDVAFDVDVIATEIGATNEAAPATDTATSGLSGRLQRIAQRLSSLLSRMPAQAGVWDYRAGTSGTVVIPADGKVLQITAIALGGAGSVVINGGDTVPIPYDATDKVSSDLSIGPKGNLVAPTLEFADTDAFFVEFVV